MELIVLLGMVEEVVYRHRGRIKNMDKQRHLGESELGHVRRERQGKQERSH